ncbi:MAG: hypothetical protein NT039_02680 [Candidatus Berkelbacteria bacterium]|nr:hypothetical protein [Candidatus Berkelbacteria bacterium]
MNYHGLRPWYPRSDASASSTPPPLASTRFGLARIPARRERYLFIKFFAYLVLVSGFLCLLAALISSILVWFYFKDAQIGKKLILELVILISGVMGLFISLGLYQYLISFIGVDQEIKKIKEEVEDLEEKVEK